MKIVLDTNVYIAAALKGGFIQDLLELSGSNQIEILTSDEILTELKEKLSQKFHWSDERIDFFITTIKKGIKKIKITEKFTVIKNDPDDNKILECGVSGKADLIITSDKDLLRLKSFKNIGIIHPKTFAWTFPKVLKRRKS